MTSSGNDTSDHPWNGICIDDGTGRNIVYISNVDKSRSRLQPPNYTPELFANGERRYYYRGNCIRCRKPFIPIILSMERKTKLFSLNICENCIVSTIPVPVTLRRDGDQIWEYHRDTPKILYCDLAAQVDDLDRRNADLLDRSRRASYGSLVDAKNRRNQSRFHTLRQNAAAFNIKEGKGLSWGFGDIFDEYFGEINDNKQPHGRGAKFYSDGSMYVGEFSRGKRHTETSALWTKTDGSSYEGTWMNNQKHGRGVQNYPDGSVYKGEFARGFEHGHGAIEYRTGAKFEGKFRFGKRDGPGVLKHPDGTYERRNFRDLDSLYMEKQPPDIDESFESFLDGDGSSAYLQPKSLMQLAIDATAKVMYLRRDLVPAQKIIKKVLNDKLKPLLAHKYLHSRGSAVPSEGFVSSAIAVAFMPVPVIRVSGAKLTAIDTESMIYFQSSNKALNSIELRANKLESLSVYTIVNELVSNSWPNLRFLDLSFNRLDNISIENIVRGVRNMTQLQVLRLSGCRIDSAGVALISGLLESDKQIKELDLSFNAAKYVGAEKIALALTKNKSLTSLNLRQNDLSEVGGQYIAEAMQYNFQIRVLVLVDNRIGPETMSLISGRLRGGMRDALTSFRATKSELTIPHLYSIHRFDQPSRTRKGSVEVQPGDIEELTSENMIEIGPLEEVSDKQ